MSPMSEQPVTLAVLTTALAQFHREIILPEMQRVVHEAVSASERRLQGHIDGILHKLDKLETEYELLKVGLKRVETQVGALGALYQDLLGAVNRLEERLSRLEERLSRLEERLSRVEERLSRVEHQVDSLVAAQEKEPLRAELADLRARVDRLQAQVRSLESRLDQ
jgi:chromosome segregation ATPase